MKSATILTPEQIRAARALLNWSRDDLSGLSGISLRAIVMIENGEANPRTETMKQLCIALTEAGVIFIKENGGGPGVRLKKRY